MSNKFEDLYGNVMDSDLIVTHEQNGFMTSEDKIKLDDIQLGATNYVHPSTHPASMITQDATHRFVSDTEKNAWNAKANNSLATQTANGLMSAADKKKLDNLDKISILNMIYPIGSIYISTVNKSPSTFIGGSWEAFGTGRTIIGVDTNQTEFNTVNKTGGSKSLQSHTHSASTNSTGAHTHTGNTSSTGAHNHSASTNSAGAHTHTVTGTVASAGAHTHTISNNVVNNLKQGPKTDAWAQSYGVATSTTSSAGSHSHTFSSGKAASAGGHSHTVTVNNNSNHSHTITANSAGGHSHTVTVSSAGSGNSQNLPPYITVYMWKRTA